MFLWIARKKFKCSYIVNTTEFIPDISFPIPKNLIIYWMAKDAYSA